MAERFLDKSPADGGHRKKPLEMRRVEKLTRHLLWKYIKRRRKKKLFVECGMVINLQPVSLIPLARQNYFVVPI